MTKIISKEAFKAFVDRPDGILFIIEADTYQQALDAVLYGLREESFPVYDVQHKSTLMIRRPPGMVVHHYFYAYEGRP